MADKKPYFDPVDTKIDFVDQEKKILEGWYKDGIVQKYLDKNKSSDQYFSFIDGPITANNPMGVHHGWGRTYKDVWQRYKNMRGYKQRFQNGFDCQGLWVEVEVEKELNLKTKKDIENLVPGDKKASIAKFVDLCKERVKKYSNIQTEQSKRLAYFMDWDHSYFTLSENNNYMIWHFLKKCQEKGLIYKGHDVVAWCPRCETAISEHEILSEDYKEIIHDSIYFRLPIVGRDKGFLLVWTTTPWTIPANIAVAVDKKLDYSLIEESGNKYYVAKDLVETVFKGKKTKVMKVVKGKDLVGLKYLSPFDCLPVISEALKDFPDKMHVVIPTNDQIMPITVEEGTGIVHTSTGTGQEDFKLGKTLGLPVIAAINDTAYYLDGFGELTGKNAKKHPEIIFDILKKTGNGGSDWIFAIVPYKHKYPACWRCKTELVWKIADEWYISIDPVREDMKMVTKKINWIPKFGLKRELNWLDNMHDWLISKKNRYWGLALPIWECEKCKAFEVIGGAEELKERAVKGWNEFDGHTPHKPWIDEIELKCEMCEGTMKRIQDVGTPWLDAGIVPFSTVSDDNQSAPLYWEKREEWKKWVPADFITESFPGQFKNWFYALIAMSTVLEDIKPTKTILGFATMLDGQGRTFHKSAGNSIEFIEGADKFGADVIRWICCKADPSNNILFGDKLIKETRGKFHLKLWNIYNFFITYANLDGWEPYDDKKEKSESLLDKWIIARLGHTVDAVTEGLDKFDAFSASNEIEKFVDDLSNWYIRRSRNRVGPAAESDVDKRNFYKSIQEVLVTLSKILSPFNPFISEAIFKNLTKEESVHLSDWPDDIPKIDVDLINQMTNLRKVIEKVHAARKDAGILIKQPLLSVKVVTPDIQKFDKEVLSLAKDELNIKEIIFEKGKEAVLLDTTFTPELEEETKARDLIRRIQEQRKEMGLSLSQITTVEVDWLPKNPETVEKIKRKTLSSSLKLGKELKLSIES